MMPEFRKDPVSGLWVIISAERAKRPQHRAFREDSVETEPCPFCAGNEAMTPPEVLIYRPDQIQANKAGWSVRVVPNKYPALVNDDNGLRNDNGFYESIHGRGVHEVIIESPDHVESMSMLPEKQLEAVLLAYRDRILQLRADKRWRYILIYKNQGAEAGATLPHVHSQLIALPSIPKAVLEEIDGAKRFYVANRRCIYCEMIRKEIDERTRIVAEHERFIVFCPYAARFPFELWILPRRHSPCFEAGLKDDCIDLARALRETLITFNRQLDNPPLNYIIHSKALDEAENEFYHWHMEIMPRLTQVAGFEWGSGFYINPVAPEEAARLLRNLRL
jgi:UDPglucose--hexose-1-phosphate uridylyltransferase